MNNKTVTLHVPAWCEGPYDTLDVEYDIDLSFAEMKSDFEEFLDQLRVKLLKFVAKEVEELGKKNKKRTFRHKFTKQDKEINGRTGFYQFVWCEEAWEDIYFYDEDDDNCIDNQTDYTIKFNDPNMTDITCGSIQELFDTLMDLRTAM